MPGPNTLLVSILLLLVASFGGWKPSPQGTCLPIDMEVRQKPSGTGASIEIDLKGRDKEGYSINLIMPHGKRVLDAKTLEFDNLERGEYIVVVTTREDENYCPTYVNVSIE